MAGMYDVAPAELRTGASGLGDDGASLAGAGATCTGAIATAAGAVPGGGLVGALGMLGEVTGERCAEMTTAIEGAGANLTTSATRYEHDDMVAAALITPQMQL